MKIICGYCGIEFYHEDGKRGKSPKYCSKECKYEADKKHKRIQWAATSPFKKSHCDMCGKELSKGRSRFCSTECKTRYNHLKQGRISHNKIFTKTCVICGKTFDTWRTRKSTCSEDCKKELRRIHSNENHVRRYREKNPGAVSRDEILERSREKREIKEREKEERRKQKQQEVEKRKAEREALKSKEPKRYVKKCIICGNEFETIYPQKIYCSDKCSRKNYKSRHPNKKKRYKGITIDDDITLAKVAERDGNICQICGLFVDWDDRENIENTTICGGMYPSIDHIVPISCGGLHSWENVQLAHRVCNTRKSNKVG